MWKRGNVNWKFRHYTVCIISTVQLERRWWAWLECWRILQTPPSTRAPGLLYDVTEFPLIRAFPVLQLPSVIYPKANWIRSASDSTQATKLRWNRSKTTLHFKHFTQKLSYTWKWNLITVRMQRKHFPLKQCFISQWKTNVALRGKIVYFNVRFLHGTPRNTIVLPRSKNILYTLLSEVTAI